MRQGMCQEISQEMSQGGNQGLSQGMNKGIKVEHCILKVFIFLRVAPFPL